MTVDQELVGTNVFAYAASDPSGVMFALEEIAEDGGHPLAAELEAMLSAVDPETVAHERLNPEFLFFHGDGPDDMQDREARLSSVRQVVERTVDELRIDLLRVASSEQRPSPYDHPALSDLEVGADHLVPLAEFQVDGLALMRNGHAFSPVPSVESSNAAYWFMQTVVQRHLTGAISVRLDPLMHRPAPEFRHIDYRMWLYGRHLDLRALVAMSEEQFGTWIPGRLSRHSAFTDYVWSPRDGDLHLTLEEIPQLEQVGLRGSRYFHAIYDPTKDSFIHLDGAVRIFTREQWERRRTAHVRNAGKIGARVKTFRATADLQVEDVTSLGATYFVWNYDVAKFFGMPVPDALLA